MSQGAGIVCTSGAVTELRGCSRNRVAAGIRVVRIRACWVEEHDLVVVFGERHLNVPTNTKIDGQFRSQLDVVLNVRREIQVAQTFFLRVGPVVRIRKSQQEAGK